MATGMEAERENYLQFGDIFPHLILFVPMVIVMEIIAMIPLKEL